MARLTNPAVGKYTCSCANCDEIEAWIEDMGGDTAHMCVNCPIQALVNKLAVYEDEEEAKSDDGK